MAVNSTCFHVPYNASGAAMVFGHITALLCTQTAMSCLTTESEKISTVRCLPLHVLCKSREAASPQL